MTDSGREPESDDELWDPFDPEAASGSPGDEPADLERVADPGAAPWSPDDGADGIGTYGLSRPAPPPPDFGASVPSAPGPEPPRPTSQSDAGPPGEPVERPRRRKRKRRRRRERRPVADVPLRTALGYPFEGSGPAVLAISAALLGLSRFVPIVGPVLGLVVLLWMGMLFLESANYLQEGIPGGPRFPSMDLADLQVGLFGMAVMVIGMLPYVIGRSVIYRLGGESPVWELLFWPLPMFYLPMAFIVLADAEHERGLDPRLVFRAIRQVGSQYFVLVTVASAAFLVPSVTLALLEISFPIRSIINSFLILYLMLALLRAVGILYLRRGLNSGDLPADDSEHGAESAA